MKNIRNLYIVIFVTIFSSSCASFTASRDYKIIEGTKNGLVVVSLTQPFQVIKWMFRNVDSGKEYLLSTTTRLGNEPILYDNTFVYPLVLPEGDYEFYQWTQPETGYYYKSTSQFSIIFKSIPGKVAYIGNLYIDVGLGAINTLKESNSYQLRVRDNNEVEIPLFKKHYTNIKDEQIDIHLMKSIR